jgi:hypothetical protein
MLTGAEPRVRSNQSLELSKNDFLKQFRETVEYADWSKKVWMKVVRFIVFLRMTIEVVFQHLGK